MFGIDRLKLFPEAIVRCARFAGKDKAIILDQIDITNYFPLSIDSVLSFIRRNTKMGAKIESMREDIPEYPITALREALINALVHSDYSVKGVYITIAIFDDRIEFTNPGGLPFGLTLEQALSGSSKVRNRVIGKVFRELKLIEQ